MQDASKNGIAPKTKAERRAQREHELAVKQEALPSKKYGVILADLRVLQ
jgi:hypothetical protein